MRHLVGASARLAVWLVLWIGGAVVAANAVTSLLGGGEYLLAALAFLLALGGLAACALALLVPLFFLED